MLDSQRQPRAVRPPPVTASSVSSSFNNIITNKRGGLLAAPSALPVQSLGDNYNVREGEGEREGGRMRVCVLKCMHPD